MNLSSAFASVISVKDFSLKHTFESAQPLTFHAEYSNLTNTITYTSGGSIVNVGATGPPEKVRLLVVGEDQSYTVREVTRRFRLADNMQSMYKRIATDRLMERSIEEYRGMRVTLNDPWETTLCFIISQFNNVKRIRLITKNLMEMFGEPITDDYGRVIARSFPTSASIKRATERELMACGAGFRAKYIRSASEYCTDSLNLQGLARKSYAELKEELLQIDGVGEKVADCIALFGYGKLEAFPVDVWIQRAMEKAYFDGRKTSPKKIREFAEMQWGKYAGLAQQYIFHAARVGGTASEKKRPARLSKE